MPIPAPASIKIKLIHNVFILATIYESITSGIGYTLSYWFLLKIKITSAFISIFAVPFIAVFVGYLFISGTLNWQYYISSTLILESITMPFFFKK